MLFLEGKGRELVAQFKSHMLEASQAERYEEAVRWRNLLRSIEVTVEKQKMVLRGGDSDVLGYHRDADRLEIVLLFIRAGVLTGSRQFSLSWGLGDAEGISAFLPQYYTGGTYIPEEILLPLDIEDGAALADVLADAKGRRVTVLHPVRGVKRELVDLAAKNAAAALRERDEKQASVETLLGELHKRLHLSRLPRRIECYDISTIQGRFSVGSGVSFLNGAADKKGYRHYRIRDVEGQDDFAMLREVFSRRFREETIQKDGLPDLVVVDGGVGQLNATLEIMAELGLNGRFDLVSLAKSRVTRAVESTAISRSDERVFLPGRKNPVVLRQNSAPLLLLAAIRDEAHRFAIEYHRTLRSKGSISSGIEQIPGIGAKRRTALLRHFGSLQRLKEASMEDIATVEGMTRSLAESVYTHLRQEAGGP
jgi:excinuclease ABC subunit C